MNKNNKNFKTQRRSRARTRISFQLARKYPSKRICDRYCTIQESLETSLQQMKLMREGKLPKKSWREVFKEFIDEHREELYAFAEQNTPKNSKGQACIEKDDGWADEDCWDEYYRFLTNTTEE